MWSVPFNRNAILSSGDTPDDPSMPTRAVSPKDANSNPGSSSDTVDDLGDVGSDFEQNENPTPLAGVVVGNT